jgi:hypothetical protein
MSFVVETLGGDRISLGRDFPHLSIPALGPTQPPIHWVPHLFPGVKRPERGVDHPPPSSAEVEGRIELARPFCLRGLFQGEIYIYLIGVETLNISR